jgi:hypothetical protein
MDDVRILRQYDDRINLSNIGRVPLYVRQRARVIDAAREEARLEMGKGALPVLTVKA